MYLDCNYPKLFFMKQLGVNVEKLNYQFVVPHTKMSPKSTTLYVAKGFQLHWEDATLQAMLANFWTRTGFRSCHPLKQFLPKHAKSLIKESLMGLYAEDGDLVAFNGVLPHGPNLNNTTSTRIASYPFIAPNILVGGEEKSYLPNPPASVIHSIRTGACPEFAAHPMCSYKLPSFYQNFTPMLPTIELPQSQPFKCLFNLEPWEAFDTSELAEELFGPISPKRNEVVATLEDPVIQALRVYNNTMEQQLDYHEHHGSYNDRNCQLCQRLANLTLEEWWHSSTAVDHHLKQDCHCERCARVKQHGWHHWKESGGCSCRICKP
jgi:hypothetical protein